MVKDVTAKAASKSRGSRKLRGSRACDCCHVRKVRCDIDHVGPGEPCTNCRLDKQACVSYRGSRARQCSAQVKSRAASETVLTTYNRLAAKVGVVNEPCDTAPSMSSEVVTPEELSLAGAAHQRPSEKRLLPKKTNATAIMDLPVADLCMQARRGATNPCTQISHLRASNKQAPDLMNVPRLGFKELSISPGLDDHITFSYYDFLNFEPLSKVQPDDIRYMELTGSLHIPMRSVLDELVREYFMHVHPVLPVVDERSFWSMYEDSIMDLEKPERLSLFVFQSMLFAACATVPLDVLRCCGFSSVRQARGTFYRRAKTVFDLCKEQDYYAVAQGALLLTYYTTNSDPFTNSQWLSIAIQNARVINAQLYHRDQSLSNHERGRRKRLWWCCILRDRVMPLGMRRAVQITHEHFDFNQSFMEEDLAHEIGFSRVYDAETQGQLVKIIVAQCDLAVVLTDVLNTCYPLDGSQAVSHLPPPDLKITKERILRSRLKLVDWFTRLSLQNASPRDPNSYHVSVTLYTNLLYIYYHGARLALCQYEILVLESYLEFVENDNIQSLHHAKVEMRLAVGTITELVKALIWLKVAQYLPVSAAAYTALPLVLSALDFKMSSDRTQAATRRRQLDIYVEAMRLYRKKYDGSEQVSAVIERLLNIAEPETRRICSSAVITTPQRSLVLSRKSKTWCDILNQCPKTYLRITLALDMAFSRGKFPEEADFPTSFRVTEIDAKDNEEKFCSEKTLSGNYIDVSMPCMQMSKSAEDEDEFQGLPHAAGKTNINLDFADVFGEHRESSEYQHSWLDDVRDLFDITIPA